MPKPPLLLPDGVRTTDIITATQFAVVFPVRTINDVLERCGRATVRERTLPNEYVVFFVMMLALFRESAHREVYRCIAEALYRLAGRSRRKIQIPSSSALSQARQRLGDEPFQILFNDLAVPRGRADQPGVFYRSWRKMAIDGCVIDTDNTAANRNFFGAAKNQHDTAAANPQVRFVTLMEIGTHLFVKAEMGGYEDGETTLAQGIFQHLTPDMILLADRNFYSFETFKRVSETGAALLFRIQRGMSFESVKQFSDGSHLVQLHSSKDWSKSKGISARLIQYKVTGSNDKYFLLTNILSPDDAPADELAALYHERWEHENTLDELKTHLNASSLVLRSKTPSLAKQELWGLLMTHYVVRSNMNEAAIRAGIDPDRLSFTHTVHVIRRALVRSTSDFPPSSPQTEAAE